MIRPLRKYHFLIWRILAALLPVMFCMAIILRPATPPQYGEMSNEDFTFTITKLTNDRGRLIIELKNSLRVPSCVVYVSSPSQDVLVGKIDQIGSYHFDIPVFEKVVTVRLYDPIHKKEITQADVFYTHE